MSTTCPKCSVPSDISDMWHQMLIDLENLGWPCRLVELPKYCAKLIKGLQSVQGKLADMTAAKNKAVDALKQAVPTVEQESPAEAHYIRKLITELEEVKE